MLGVAHDAVEVHRLERLVAEEVVARHDHAGDPEEQDVRARDERVAGIEAGQVRRPVRPAERGERPQPGREPGVEHVGVLLDRAAARGAGLRVLAVGPLAAGGALGAGEHRDAVAPPQLPRDVPVADVLHPVLVRRAPALGDEANRPGAVRLERRLCERLHLHEPLIGQPRLHHRVAAVAVAHRVPMRLHFCEQAALLEHVDDLFAGIEAVELGERLRHARRMLHPPVLGHHQGHLELVSQPDLEVRRVVRRSHLHEARSEPGLDCLIREDRHRQVGDRQPGDFAHETAMARIFGIHRHRRIAEQRFGARGGHGQVRRGAALHGITDVIQLAFDVPGFGLFVRQRREAARAPMDHPMPAVNEPLLPQAHEHFPHGPRVRRVEREPRPAPIARRADHLELLENRGAGVAYERPDARDERLAAEVEAGLPLFRDETLHHVLRGDPGVVGAGEP